MSSKDRFVGKAKEAAGKATGNEELASEGRSQHAKGKAGEAIQEAKDTAQGAAEAAKETFSRDEDEQDDEQQG